MTLVGRTKSIYRVLRFVCSLLGRTKDTALKTLEWLNETKELDGTEVYGIEALRERWKQSHRMTA